MYLEQEWIMPEKIDADIAEIKVFMQEIKDFMKHSGPALDQAWINKDDITHLKIKQKIIQVLGIGAVLAFISNFVRKLF